MIPFKPMELTDKDWMAQRYRENTLMSSMYCFTTNYLLRKPYRIQVADVDGFLCLKSGWGKRTFYYFPVGSGDRKVMMDKLLLDAKSRRVPFRLHALLDEHKEWLETEYPGKFQCQRVSAICDYIYRTEKLAQLTGRKLANKRRQIARFTENATWSCERIIPEKIPECKAMHEKWCRQRMGRKDHFLKEEILGVNTIFREFEALGLTGVLLRQNGKVVAFSIGEPLNDKSFVVHIEKAFADIQGAYSMINQQTVLNVCMGLEYVNRSYDLGIEGLRTAKMSYDPDIVLNVYEVNAEIQRSLPYRALRRAYHALRHEEK